ncbi:hypothetical protein [Blastococcus sp. SYSU DS0973]
MQEYTIPSGKSPRPTRGGWIERALREFRVVLLDQRGTGRSSRVTGRRMSAFAAPAAAAAHLLAFRADSIVVYPEHEHDGLRVGDVLDRLLTVRSR